MSRYTEEQKKLLKLEMETLNLSGRIRDKYKAGEKEEILSKLLDRYIRRSKKTQEHRREIGRPKLDIKEKKKAISIKLHPNLIKWMDRQPEKRPELIETALKNYYQVEIEYDNNCNDLF